MIKVVAEIGQCKGSVDYAVKAMAAAKGAGCWGVKIQLLQPELIAQASAPTYWHETRPEIASQRDNFAATGCLDYGYLPELVDAARDLDIWLVATPFDHFAVNAMAAANVPFCKIASGDITNRHLINEASMAYPGRVILSTGASTWTEIDRAIEWVRDDGSNPYAVLACSLAYPTHHADAELFRVCSLASANLSRTMVGYSDHTFGSMTAAVAVGAGAQMLEKHVTLDASDSTVPDNAFALEPADLKVYVDCANLAEEMCGTGYLGATDAERPARDGARRTLCAARAIPAGKVITRADLVPLRPLVEECVGAEHWLDLLGATTRTAVAEGDPIPKSAVPSASTW